MRIPQRPNVSSPAYARRSLPPLFCVQYLLVWDEDDDVGVETSATEGGEKSKVSSMHTSGFRDFLLKAELMKAITDCGFEHPSQGELAQTAVTVTVTVTVTKQLDMLRIRMPTHAATHREVPVLRSHDT